MMKVDQIEQDIQISQAYEGSSLLGNARSNFISKVYSILSLQLIITVLFVTATMASSSYAAFQAQNMWIFYCMAIGSIAFIIPLACCRFSKQVPINYFLLLGFTLCESYLVSMICSLYTPESVLQAAAATCAATIGLTLYAMRTKSDFTQCTHWMLGFFWSFFFITFFMTLINVFFIQSDIFTILIAIGIASIYSIYLIIDTQLILGGKNVELTMDNYVLGAVILYIDIIQLFIEILKIIGKKKD